MNKYIKALSEVLDVDLSQYEDMTREEILSMLEREQLAQILAI